MQKGQKNTSVTVKFKPCLIFIIKCIINDMQKVTNVLEETRSVQEQNGRTLKERLVNTMKSRILSGALKPGDRLQPERVLAEEFGISRGSVNQGILDLERMGFLRIVPRKGAFVAEYVKNATPETLSAVMSYDSTLIDSALFRDLMDMRILIELECTRLACRNINTEALKILSECTAAIYNAQEDELVDAIYDFHRSVAAISGNAAYSMVFQSFEKMLRNLIRTHYSDKNELKKCLPMYHELAAALSVGDAAEAETLMARILKRASDYLNAMLINREKEMANEK